MVFPALCYQPKINELIFLMYFQNQLDLLPNIIGLAASLKREQSLPFVYLVNNPFTQIVILLSTYHYFTHN
ncbi:hypothetical protein LL050_003792, partial [Providencia rettgeri]